MWGVDLCWGQKKLGVKGVCIPIWLCDWMGKGRASHGIGVIVGLCAGEKKGRLREWHAAEEENTQKFLHSYCGKGNN